MRKLMCLFLLVFLLIYSSNGFAIVIHVPGYKASIFGFAAGSGDDLDVDELGTVFAPSGTGGGQGLPGLVRFFRNGVGIRGGANGYSAAVSQEEAIYIATRALGENILKVNWPASKVATELVAEGIEWTWLALDSDGNLYGNVWAGRVDVKGIYTIDTQNGDYKQIVAGGPGPNGQGTYRDMVFGPDGKLYVTGSVGRDYGLFRLDGDTFTKFASLPHGGLGLTVDPSGTFYTATSFQDSFSEVWMIKPSGQAILLASELNHPSGIAYDATTGRLYVRDQKWPYTIYSIERTNLSVSPQSKLAALWGAIKDSR